MHAQIRIKQLSYLLQKNNGCKLGTNFERRNLSHLFIVDDLKLFPTSSEKLRLLETVVQFSNDVKVEFGATKCKFQYITRGK